MLSLLPGDCGSSHRDITLVAGLLLRNIFGDELSAIPMALQKLPMHSKERLQNWQMLILILNQNWKDLVSQWLHT